VKFNKRRAERLRRRIHRAKAIFTNVTNGLGTTLRKVRLKVR
jgi:hypothetical protein